MELDFMETLSRINARLYLLAEIDKYKSCVSVLRLVSLEHLKAWE